MLFPLHFCFLGLQGCWNRDRCINQDETSTFSSVVRFKQQAVSGREILRCMGKEGGRGGEKRRESKKSGGEALPEDSVSQRIVSELREGAM